MNVYENTMIFNGIHQMAPAYVILSISGSVCSPLTVRMFYLLTESVNIHDVINALPNIMITMAKIHTF